MAKPIRDQFHFINIEAKPVRLSVAINATFHTYGIPPNSHMYVEIRYCAGERRKSVAAAVIYYLGGILVTSRLDLAVEFLRVLNADFHEVQSGYNAHLLEPTAPTPLPAALYAPQARALTL